MLGKLKLKRRSRKEIVDWVEQNYQIYPKTSNNSQK